MASNIATALHPVLKVFRHRRCIICARVAAVETESAGSAAAHRVTAQLRDKFLLRLDWLSTANGASLILNSATALSGLAPPSHVYGRGRGSAADSAALTSKEIPASKVQRNGTNDATSTSSTKYIPIRLDQGDRRTFIGGSDARIIMGGDEAELI